MASKPRLPIWLMGLTNSPLGISGAVALLITPQLLAAQHVPEQQIAQITGLALVPGFCAFLVAPILDVRLSRRTYTVLFSALTGIFTFLALLEIGNLAVLGWLLFAVIFAAQLSVSAAGGWLTSLVPKEDESKLGAWFVVGNIGGFGITSIIGIILLRALPYAVGAAILGVLVVLPATVCAFLPAPGPDRRLAKESFGQFSADLLRLVRQPSVLMSLVLFGVPAASFALTNTLGGLGRDYGASERFVALIGGAGVTIAGVFGSLIVPPLAKRAPPRALYLAIGAVGALFTLALIVLPRTPAFYTLAMVGENIGQSAAFATANFVMFRAIGKDNPFAATQYALMLAAQSLPLSYMQVLDGRAYGASGLPGAYLMDGGLGLLACAALVVLLMLAARRALGSTAEAPAKP
ncbi:MAG: MFS transporter [Phenylobacterium sp.]|nr:MAG: MFS transporter [Phenylobacterium sp.]